MSDYSLTLKNLLFNDRKFMELIRYYNQKISFASFTAKFVDQFRKGFYNLKIQVQVCHTISNCIDFDNSHLEGKIYLYDNQELIDLIIQ